MKEAIIESLFAEKLERLPPFAARLRQLYPSKQLMLKFGVEVIRVWGSSAMTSIDACERSHAQFRQRASSGGPGRSPVVVANRVVCGQAHAEHIALGGSCPPQGRHALAKIQDIAVGATSANNGGANKHAGSAFIRFLNCKMSSFKRLQGQGSSITQAQREQVVEIARREWAEMRTNNVAEHEQWLLATRASKHQQLVGAGVRGDAQVLGLPNFVGLWGGSTHQDLMFDVETMLRHGMGGSCKDADAWRDDGMRVQSVVPDRCCGSADFKVFGCIGEKRMFAELTASTPT